MFEFKIEVIKIEMEVEVTVKDMDHVYVNLETAQETLVRLLHAINFSFNDSDTMRWCIYGDYDQAQVQGDVDEYVKAIDMLSKGFASKFGCSTAGGGGNMM